MRDQSNDIVNQAYSQLFESLKEASELFESEVRGYNSDAAFRLSQKATKFITSWMRDYYLFQKQFDALFGRSLMQPAADQFTAVVALTLQKYLSAMNSKGIVKSESNLEKKRGSLHPDISIWSKNGTLLAVIECKTNLGRQRTTWKKQYDVRTKEYCKLNRECLSFLCVLTQRNWEVSWEEFSNSSLAGKRWFCLSKVWPSELGEELALNIIHPLEPMFLEISKRLEVPA